MKTSLPLLCLLALLALPASAQEVVVGAGITEYHDDGASGPFVFSLEIHSEPVANIGPLRLSVTGGATLDFERDVFVGGGFSAWLPLSRSIFMEAALTPGYYHAGDDDQDLGGPVQFRSLIGAGWRMSDMAALSLGLSHVSNAGFYDDNPGMNALSLRLRRRF